MTILSFSLLSAAIMRTLRENKINFYKNELNFRKIAQELYKDNATERSIYICDLTKVQRQFELWQDCLPNIKPYYAVKTNNDALVVKTLAELGAGFDCASVEEMQMVLEAGVTGDRIIFAHPCKPLSHLQYAQQHQINISTVDTEFELFKLKQHFPNSDIVLRFRSDAKICGWPLGKKFGCEAQTDTAALILLARSLQLKIAGTSFHVGCECEDLEAFVRALSTARELYDVGKMLGYDMNFVDIGGGYHGGNNEFFKKAKTISSSLDLYFGNEPIKCISEPGRYFVEAAFTLVCKITGKREMRNALGQLESIMYFINDGKYGSFIDTGRDFSNVMYFSENHLEQQKYKTTIWGPTCDSTDKIVDNLYLPRLHRGDLLAFPNMGAYTLCLASKFNGIPLPKVVYYQQQN